MHAMNEAQKQRRNRDTAVVDMAKLCAAKACTFQIWHDEVCKTSSIHKRQLEYDSYPPTFMFFSQDFWCITEIVQLELKYVDLNLSFEGMLCSGILNVFNVSNIIIK